METLIWIIVALWIIGKLISKIASSTNTNGQSCTPMKTGSDYHSEERNIGLECPRCQSGLIMKLQSKKGNTYYRCGNYPNCDFVAFDLPTGVNCPNEGCKGTIVEKQSSSGEIFYGCSAYPSCNFTSARKPFPYCCPNCGSAYLIEESTTQDRTTYICSFCGYKTNTDIISIPCYNCGEKSLYEKESYEEGRIFICRTCNFKASALDYK